MGSTKRLGWAFFAGAAAVLAFASASCRRSTRYDAYVDVTRITSVPADGSNATTLDVEVTYVECPGRPVEVLRGGGDFAACAGKYKVGEKLKVSIDHAPTGEGHYKWSVRTVGECSLVAHPSEEAAYALVRECGDWSANRTGAAFRCRAIADEALVEKCPWFRRQ